MKNNTIKVLYSFALSFMINLIFISVYAFYNYNQYFHDAKESFHSQVREMNAKFDNYGYILNLVTDLWSAQQHSASASKPSQQGDFYHLGMATLSPQGKQVHDFMNSLDNDILKTLNDNNVRPFARSIKHQEIISLVPFSDEELTPLLAKSRCEETETCGEPHDDLHYSLVHHTLLDGKPSVVILKRLKGTSFYVMFHVSLTAPSAANLNRDKTHFNDKPFKFIELFAKNHTAVLNENTDAVFFHYARFGYLIIERHALFAPIQNILMLFLASWIFLAIIFYMMLYLKHKNLLIKEKTDRSITDKLTGAYNRDFLEMVLLQDSSLHNGGTVLYLDGNKVKMINDNFGHDYGDIAIKMICDAIKSSVRKEDEVIRMGGDEFIAVLKGCQRREAENVFNKITKALKLQSVSKLPFVEGGVSVAPGYCEFSNPAEFENAITNADLAMLEFKQANNQGRDAHTP